MNRSPKLWEIVAAFIPVISGLVIWMWNLAATVKGHDKDIEYLKQSQVEYKQDIKDIKEKMETILLKIENKQDR
jgi:hypothetical protein